MLGAITVAKLWISILEPVSSSISENEATQLKSKAILQLSFDDF